MPAIVTRGGMSARGFGFATTSLGAGAWIGIGYDSTYTSTFMGTYVGITLDASNNMYLTGSTNDIAGTNGTTVGLLTKLNSAGVVQFQKRTPYAFSYPNYFNGTALDSSGNIYVGGQSTLSADPYARMYWAKYDSTGALQSQTRSYDGTIFPSTANAYVYGASGDSSGNMYVTTSINNGMGYIIKYSTAGSITWLRQISVTAQFQVRIKTGINPSGNFAVHIGTSNTICACTGAQQYDTTIISFNSAGTKQWQFSQIQTGPQGNEPFIDSSNNVYFTWIGTPNVFITKFDSTGTLQWARGYNQGGTGPITTDSSGNVYAVYGLNIVKYNSSGAIQWQRLLNATVSGSNVTLSINAISISSDGFMCLAGRVFMAVGSSYYYTFVARLPIDGSKTGSYSVSSNAGSPVVIAYTTATGTDSAKSVSNFGQTVNANTVGPATSTNVPTINNATLTETVTNIP